MLTTWKEFFGKKMPAHTLVAVAALAQPEFLIEMKAGAVLYGAEGHACTGLRKHRLPQQRSRTRNLSLGEYV
jgi:hypothetical protein